MANSSTFPTSLDTFVDPTPQTLMVVTSHAGQHDKINDAVANAQAYIGAAGSAVTSSLTYGLRSQQDPGHTHTATSVPSVRGPTGLAGTNGATGPTGHTGVAGANGATGPTGLGGTNGTTGPTGSQGVTGPQQPTGAMVAFAGATPPGGWILCNGASLLRATFIALFAVCGTTYGSVDGTHFNVPDMRTRVPAGFSSGDPYFGTRGGASGAETHSLTTTQLARHAHTDSGHTHGTSDPGHLHGYAFWQNTGVGVRNDISQVLVVGGDRFNQNTNGATTGVSVVQGHASITNTGSGTAFPIIQPSLTVQWIIKT